MSVFPVRYPARLPLQNSLSGILTNKNNQNSAPITAKGGKSDSVAFGENEKATNARNQLVIRHEEAHRSASGPQASGSPVYDKTLDADGRVFFAGGHQGISIPGSVDKNAPLDQIERTKTAANYVIKGAEAPSSFDELSDADKQVAASGRQILAQAENAKSQKLSNPDKPKQGLVGQNLNLIG